MRRVLLLVRKDLRRRIRRPLGYVLLLAFPVIFAAMLALTFGGGGKTGVPRIHMFVEDQDQTMVSGLIVSSLGSSQVAEFFEIEVLAAVDDGGEDGSYDGFQRMERGEASALLRIPEGFGDSVLEGQPTHLELIRNPAQQILPEAAEQSAVVLAELLSSASRLLREPLDQMVSMAESGQASPSDLDVAAIAVQVNHIIARSDTFLFPPAITLETGPSPYAEADDQDAADGEDDADDGDGASASTTALIFLMIFPGVAVYALFMLGDQAMRDLLIEAAGGTLHRQLAGPASPTLVLFSKAVYAGVLSLLSLLILASIAALAASRPVDPLGFLALSLALVLAITGVAAAVYGLAPSERSGATIGSMLYLGMGFASGSFFQLESLPTVMRRIAPYTPFYWANQGYRELLGSGAGVAELLPHIGILAATGTVFFFLGATMLRRQVLRGAA